MSGLFDLDIQADPIERVEIPFGEWLPDLPELNNPGAVEALNVIPLDGNYSPFPQLVPTSVLPEVVRGATAVVSPDDITQIYAGTIAGIYTKFGGADFTNIYTAVSSENYAWQFIRVNEQMVALHREHDPVRTPVGSVTPPVVVGGSPPRANCGAQVGDFLMLGDLMIDPDDGGGRFPNRVRWGGFNNIDSPWVTDPATQADFQDMPAEGGPVVAISGRENGTIFQARMISRATYRGPPNIFDIVVVEDKRGAIARDCVVDVGPYKFFIAEDGFFQWNGTNAVPIGDMKVNRYFYKRLHYGSRSRIVGAADFANGCVHWAFPTTASGILDEVITYSYRENRFSHMKMSLEHILSSALSNVSSEELSGPAEGYDVSFDSILFQMGGRSVLAGFNSDHTYGLFAGVPMEATIDTGEYTAPNARRVFVNQVKPLVDLNSAVASVQIAKREQLIGQSLVFGDPVPQEADGQCSIFDDARYMRFRTIIPAGAVWQHGLGVQIARKATGAF